MNGYALPHNIDEPPRHRSPLEGAKSRHESLSKRFCGSAIYRWRRVGSMKNTLDRLDILVLSNGHGEDLVARRITAAILKSNKNLTVGALPLVGIGSTYDRLLLKNIRLIMLNPRRTMPSAGFCAKSMRWLWADIRSGLFSLLLAQFKVIRHLAQRNHCLTIAVGDSFPLALAWLSGGRYVYVQLKKSDHMWIHHWFQRE